jgi:hypothetical protein
MKRIILIITALIAGIWFFIKLIDIPRVVVYAEEPQPVLRIPHWFKSADQYPVYWKDAGYTTGWYFKHGGKWIPAFDSPDEYLK